MAEESLGRERMWQQAAFQVLETVAAEAKEMAGSLESMFRRRSSFIRENPLVSMSLGVVEEGDDRFLFAIEGLKQKNTLNSSL